MMGDAQESLKHAADALRALDRQSGESETWPSAAGQEDGLSDRLPPDFSEAYRIVTEGLSDAVYIVDTEGCIVFCNPALRHLTVYTVEALLGRPSTELYAP